MKSRAAVRRTSVIFGCGNSKAGSRTTISVNLRARLANRYKRGRMVTRRDWPAPTCRGDSMLRHRFAVAAWIVMVAAPIARAQKLTPEQVEQSVRFINSLQASDGGYRASPRDESDLSATTASLRALKYLHPQARPRDREAVEKYVKQLYDPAKGSYSLRLGTPPDVRSTATGVMAAAELKLPLGEDAPAI